MGRCSNYSTTHRPEQEPMTYESIKDKFGKEPMSAQEFAVYLSEMEGAVITEKTVRNYVKEICDNSQGLLCTNDFLQSDNCKYEFKPRYHGLLLTLMNTDCFDSRKNDRKVRTRSKRYKKLVENIEAYLSDSDKEVVKSIPAYINAALEGYLSYHINSELSVILRTLYHLDPVVRYEFMLDFVRHLAAFRKKVNRADSRSFSTKIVYSHELDGQKDASYQKGMFESITLDRFLINYLALLVHDHSYDDTPPSISAVTLLRLLFPGLNMELNTDDVVDYLESTVEDRPRCRELIEKARSVFDCSDPIEREVFELLENVVCSQFLRPQVSEQEYQQAVRFAESCIADDKMDILNKFIRLGRENYTEEELDAIFQAQNSETPPSEKS